MSNPNHSFSTGHCKLILYIISLSLPPENEVWGKVTFSQASVILSTGGRVGFPACITGHMTRGSASRGSASEGVCITGALHPGQLGRPPRYMEYYGFQSKSGLYVSHWSVFLLPPANEVCEGYVFTGVCHSVHGGGVCVVALGECMVAPGGCAWLLSCAWLLRGGGRCVVAPRGGMCGCSQGGMHGCSGGCMVAPGGGMRGCSQGGMCGCSGEGVHGFSNEIRSMSGRYASYWNAFLLKIHL